MEETFGVEIEGYLTDEMGEFADTLALLGAEGHKSQKHPHEATSCDVAYCSVELATRVCRSETEVLASLARCMAAIPAGYTVNFTPRTPYPGEIPIAKKPRYAVMADALMREHPSGYNGMLQVAPWNATHLHFGVPSVFDADSITLLNLLNNSAPYARAVVLDRLRIKCANGHLNIWKGFTKPERLPAPRWFRNAEHLRAFVEAIPKLFVCAGDNEWKVGEGEMSFLGDLASEGVLWWLARARHAFNSIEWRPFPSIELIRIGVILDEAMRLVCSCRSYLRQHPGDYSEIRNPAVLRLYAYLSRQFAFVPATPLADYEWWKLFAR